MWDKKAEAGWGENKTPNPFFEQFYSQYKERLGTEALDVGCGKGRYTIRLARDGFKVVGVEPSAAMRRGATRKLSEAGLHAEIIEGQSDNLNFPDSNFNFVVSVGAIHHNRWKDIQKSFGEISRVLRRGGYFVFQGRSTNDTAETRQQIDDVGYTAVDLEGSKEGVIQHYFTRGELFQLARENSFAVVIKPVEQIKPSELDSRRRRARWWVVLQKE